MEGRTDCQWLIHGALVSPVLWRAQPSLNQAIEYLLCPVSYVLCPMSPVLCSVSCVVGLLLENGGRVKADGGIDPLSCVAAPRLSTVGPMLPVATLPPPQEPPTYSTQVDIPTIDISHQFSPWQVFLLSGQFNFGTPYQIKTFSDQAI